MGFRPLAGDACAFRDAFPVRGDFLLYAGRREEGKNTPLLVDYFRRFARERPGLLTLVLMGAGEVSIPPDSSHLVLDLGRVSERRKWDGYAAAHAFCQPSVNESLSIVLLESWLAGRPALVNSGCEVTREHAELSGGGLAFGDYDGFAEALGMLLDDRELAARMGNAGRRYVEEQYNWDSVIGRLLEALGVFA
jgi:glycosyltransferase involved in cell wall biosynthesis